MTPPQTDSGASSPTGVAPAKAQADKIANLVRTRENQRRSRARRREYIADLEAKYRKYEAMGAEASVEIQVAARKVLEENRRLRKILEEYGLPIDISEENPVEKLENLLNKKRKVDEDGETPLALGDPETKPSPKVAASARRGASTEAAAPGAARSNSIGPAVPEQGRQPFLITPKTEPHIDTIRQGSWDSEMGASQTPLEQPGQRHGSWAGTPSSSDQVPLQRIDTLGSGTAGTHHNVEELAAAASLSGHDPAMAYLLADGNMMLEQMYGIASNDFQGEQSSFTDFTNSAQLNSCSDAEFYWNPSQSRQQQQPPRPEQTIHQHHSLTGTPQRQRVQMLTPQHSHAGTPQPQQQLPMISQNIQHQHQHQHQSMKQRQQQHRQQQQQQQEQQEQQVQQVQHPYQSSHIYTPPGNHYRR
ncbi:hypothetical protein CAC42_6195 [Sphaceloma murrayae]|uniref:BZIP domain-containing protein n=1 Tax=Sphaceloma murrayae TaxID=2082308 RepID=A0A2K1QTH9_9PEZI|nr:hypothetical protein CAC42_6195 [Sphaceloma murrayae]